MKTLMVIASVVLALADGAYARLAYYEGFSYTTGSTLLSNGYYDGGNGGVWNVQTGSIEYANLVTAGEQAYSPTQSGGGGTVIAKLPAAVTALFQSAGTFYITFLANRNNVWVATGILDDPVTPASLTDDICLGQFSDRNEGGAYAERLFLPGWGTGWIYTWSSLNLYALRIVNDGTAGADTVQLVRNPVLINGEPDWATQSEISCATADITKAVDGLRMTSFYYIGSDPPREMYIDEIRIATSWAEAIGVRVPAPSSMAVLATGIATLRLGWRMRRRRA